VIERADADTPMKEGRKEWEMESFGKMCERGGLGPRVQRGMRALLRDPSCVEVSREDTGAARTR
jgi:hypothetical protein